MPAANELRLDDGHATFITLSNLPDVKLFEKEVTPPGFTNGGAIDTTTMRNLAYRTSAAKKLKSTSPIRATVAFATDAIPLIQAQLGINQLFTINLPDGSSLSCWGWLDEFTPSNFVEGTQPTAAITVIPSNRDDQGAEAGPTYVPPEAPEPEPPEEP